MNTSTVSFTVYDRLIKAFYAYVQVFSVDQIQRLRTVFLASSTNFGLLIQFMRNLFKPHLFICEITFDYQLNSLLTSTKYKNKSNSNTCIKGHFSFCFYVKLAMMSPSEKNSWQKFLIFQVHTKKKTKKKRRTDLFLFQIKIQACLCKPSFF